MCNRQFDDCIFFLSYFTQQQKVAEKGEKEKIAVQVAQFYSVIN